MKEIYLGIDTSNYTTSLGVVSSDGEIIANLKAPLTVKSGEVGLRQSDAVFLHAKNLPLLFDKLRVFLHDSRIIAIGVSSRPRNVEHSYMPCFLSGVSCATAASTVCASSLYTFSHQCGHIMAAILSSGALHLLDGREFASLHISGGTTELLKTRFVGDGFVQELVGGTKDLNAGQVIDRVGGMLGLDFPSGVALEALALENSQPVPKKRICINEGYVNLSGLENMAQRLYKSSENPPLVARFVLDYIAKSVCAMVDSYIDRFGESEIVFAGGVMSNSIIRNTLCSRYKAHFAHPELSRDNAVGIAYLTMLKNSTER